MKPAIEIGERNILVRPAWHFYLFPIMSLVMAGLGVRGLRDVLPLRPDHLGTDLFGLCFLCVWIGVVLGMGVSVCIRNPLTLTVDASGVTAVSLFGKRSLAWDEVRDYGFSYSGRLRGSATRYYSLYFADSALKEKRYEQKRLRGHCISIFLDEGDYLFHRDEILALCARYSCVKPFAADPEKLNGMFC